MKKELHSLSVGYAAATLSAICMFTLGVLANVGVYVNAATMMQQWHMFFNLSFFGIITGMIEAAIVGFIGGYLFAWLYNYFSEVATK